MSKLSVKAISKIGFRIPEVAKSVIKQLMKFAGLRADHIYNTAVIEISEMLRRYPEETSTFMGLDELLPKIAETTSDIDCKMAITWIFGHYGNFIPKAPYVLEKWLQDELLIISDPHFANLLLNSIARLFFERAPECQHMLGQ